VWHKIEERKHAEAREKGSGKNTHDRPSQEKPQEQQKEKQEKCQAAEAKTREKRLQIRVERTEKIQANKGTPKAASTKLKEKAPSAKQAKIVPSSSIGNQKAISTGSLKMASTGSQKPATTRLSTGSPEKGQKEEKLAEILAREASAVLATLGTSPKPKEK